MVVNNPNNWHWVDKNCFDWSKTYFNEKLVGLSAEADGAGRVKVTSVSSLEGDTEVCQRKGKVISIYDLRLVLTIEGTTATNKEFKGSITIPELAYDTEKDELQFDVSIYNEDADSEKMRGIVKRDIVPKLRTLLMTYGNDLIDTHGSDIQHEVPKKDAATSGVQASARPAVQPTDAAKRTAPVAAKTSTGENKTTGVARYNTSTLHLEPVFNTTAEQLYITLLDPQRVAAWSRSNAIIEAKEGSEYKLFGGSISGKMVKLVENERITQTWRLDSWREGHFAELDIQLKQGASETTMVVKWSGIPIGEEDRVRGNFEDYYVRAIKLTFGFGAVL